jgi:hypothetical protein
LTLTDSPHFVNAVWLDPFEVMTDSLRGNVFDPDEIVMTLTSLGAVLVAAVVHVIW